MMEDKFIFLFLLLLSYSLCYITLSFKTLKIDYPSSFTYRDISENLMINKIYTTLQVGTPPQSFNFNIEMQTPYLSLSSKEFSKEPSQVPFNKDSSLSYKFIESQEIHLDRIVDNDGFEGRYTADVSEDQFQFSTSKGSLYFFLIKEIISGYNFKYNSGIIGLDICRKSNKEGEYYKFFRMLKNSDLVDNYYFYFDFNEKNSNIGNLILGGNHNDTNKELNDPLIYNINTTYSDFGNTVNGMRWGISFDSMNITNEETKEIIEMNENALSFGFSVENNTLVLHKVFFDKFTFFKEYTDKGLCEEHSVYNDTFISYSCINDPKRINFKSFPKLTFFHKELNYTFELNYEDLTMQIGDRIYILIYFYSRMMTKDIRSVLGKPFMKKYSKILFFNWDMDLIGIYNKIIYPEKKIIKAKGIKAFIIVIIILIVLVAGLLIFIYRKRVLFTIRKKRASELEDEFTYDPNYKTLNYI